MWLGRFSRLLCNGAWGYTIWHWHDNNGRGLWPRPSRHGELTFISIVAQYTYTIIVLHSRPNSLHSYHWNFKAWCWTGPFPTYERHRYEDRPNNTHGLNDHCHTMVLSYGSNIWSTMPAIARGVGCWNRHVSTYGSLRNHRTCSFWYGCDYQLALCGMETWTVSTIFGLANWCTASAHLYAL